MNTYQFQDYIVEPQGKLSKRMIHKDSNVIAFVLNIAQGQSLPPHTHFESTLLINVMAGSGTLHVNDQASPMEENQLFQLDGPEKMSVDNTGNKTLVLYVTISPNPPSEKYSVDADM